MSSSSTLVKCATSAPSLALCKTTIARAAVISPGPVSIKYFSSHSRDDVSRTASGESQKVNNLAPEIGKKTETASPGGDSLSPAASGQGNDKGDTEDGSME